MAYKVGECPQCNNQIMVRDTKGQLNSFKPIFRQADLVFSDQHRVRTIICEDCLENPDFSKIMDAILCDESEACDNSTKEFLRGKGMPISLKLAIKARQGVRLGVRVGG